MSNLDNYKPRVKVVADSTFCKSSGTKGGTPMFSRVGKQTVAEDLTFEGEKRVQAESKIAHLTRPNKGIEKIEESSEDEENDEVYEMKDLTTSLLQSQHGKKKEDKNQKGKGVPNPKASKASAK